VRLQWVADAPLEGAEFQRVLLHEAMRHLPQPGDEVWDECAASSTAASSRPARGGGAESAQQAQPPSIKAAGPPSIAAALAPLAASPVACQLAGGAGPVRSRSQTSRRSKRSDGRLRRAPRFEGDFHAAALCATGRRFGGPGATCLAPRSAHWLVPVPAAWSRRHGVADRCAFVMVAGSVERDEADNNGGLPSCITAYLARPVAPSARQTLSTAAASWLAAATSVVPKPTALLAAEDVAALPLRLRGVARRCWRWGRPSPYVGGEMQVAQGDAEGTSVPDGGRDELLDELF
jgi:hypothetical protein